MLTVDELLAAARSQSGLDDFGDDYFRLGLEKLLAAAHAEVTLSPAGAAALRGRAITYLVNRLEIEDWYRRHPEINEEEVVAPVFGLGLPRTGSTVLQCLMAEDPAVRSLRTWESEKPCPPPETQTQDNDPRIVAMEAAQDGFAELARKAPEILTMLPLQTVRDPTECQDLMGLTSRGQGFVATMLFSYLYWQINSDMEPAYRYHKRALKLLQWRCPPKRWRLKSPVHMFNLPALVAVYPDARFVVTHRDVAESIPSMAALVAAMGKLFLENLDTRRLGASIAEFWRMGLERMLAFRELDGSKRFFDIGFRRAQADPIGVVRELYAWLGEPFTPEYERRMTAWRQAHTRSRELGAGRDMERFGLMPDALRRTFSDYLDRYRAYIEG